MGTNLAEFARKNGVKYFRISYTDLFGGQRAKLVPAQAIADMQKDGAGFAGFATWLDMTPAHPDLMAVPVREGLTVPFTEVLARASPEPMPSASDPPPDGGSPAPGPGEPGTAPPASPTSSPTTAAPPRTR